MTHVVRWTHWTFLTRKYENQHRNSSWRTFESTSSCMRTDSPGKCWSEKKFVTSCSREHHWQPPLHSRLTSELLARAKANVKTARARKGWQVRHGTRRAWASREVRMRETGKEGQLQTVSCWCGKKGHRKRDCRKRAREQKTGREDSGSWILTLGCDSLQNDGITCCAKVLINSGEALSTWPPQFLSTHQNRIVRSCDKRVMRPRSPSRKRACTCAADVERMHSVRVRKQVGAVRDVGGKATEGKGTKGKGKGKRDKAQWKLEQWPRSRHISLLCGYCKRWARKRADCRKRTKDESGGTSGGAPPNTDHLVCAHPSEPRAFHLLDRVDDDTSWIFVQSGGAHGKLTGGRSGSILVTSGSGEHVFRPTHVEPLYGGPVPNLFMGSKDATVCPWSCLKV